MPHSPLHARVGTRAEPALVLIRNNHEHGRYLLRAADDQPADPHVNSPSTSGPMSQEQAYLEWSREFSDAHANFIAARAESWSSVVRPSRSRPTWNGAASSPTPNATFIAARSRELVERRDDHRDRAFGRNDVRYIKVFRFPDDAIFDGLDGVRRAPREMIRKGQALNFAVDETALEREFERRSAEEQFPCVSGVL